MNHPTKPAQAVETLRVFATADRGMAMGHIRGKIAFVPFAAPGERVVVEIVREKRRHIETRLVRILEPSPNRRAPECPHFGSCGGCQWQHLPYAEQLEAKARSFHGFVKSRLRIEGNTPFRAPIPSPTEWGYRNRVGLKVRQVDGRVLVGFFARGSHRLVAIDTCPVAHPTIVSVLSPLRDFLQGFAPARGALPQIDLQVDGAGRLWAVVHLLRPVTPDQTRAGGGFFGQHGAVGTYLQTGRKESLVPLPNASSRIPFHLQCGDRELVLEVTPGGFVQANYAVNRALVDQILELAPTFRGQPVLDLYCGAGNFTLPLALSAAEVVGVEGYEPAAQDAERNARRNRLTRIRVLAASARHGVEALATEGFRPRFAVLDPPREGAAEVVGPLAEFGPDRILYVSCSHPTLVRDLKVLLARGYRLEWTRVADMFPQTAHIESLTLLRHRVC
jgi:23S rRNA (uracil1939-C5)-methyltransferase